MRTGQIFFSYSRVDGKFALKLGEDLRKAGVDIWIDQIDIPPSEPWDEEIEKALQQSDCLLVILSHTSVASDNVLNEINYALESKKQVLPILLESNIKKPFNIGRLQHIDFTGSYENAFNLLLKSLSLGKQLPVENKRRYGTTIRAAVMAAVVIIAGALIKINFFKQDTSGRSNAEQEINTALPIENINGKWTSEEITNPFDDHDKYKIDFDLKVMGDEIVGSISKVSTVKGNDYIIKKGFIDGKIRNNIISFHTVEQSVSGGQFETFKDFYRGSVSKEEIKFNLQSDRSTGFPGQEFVAKPGL